MKRLGPLALVLAFAGWLIWKFALPFAFSTSGGPIDLDPDPIQEAIDPPEQIVVERGGRKFTIEKTHRYVVTGEVLSATSYDLTWGNDFFDVDVGLIWGPQRAQMQERYKFGQMGRFLFWRSEGPVSQADRDDIGRHISNSHLIPADGRSKLASAVRWVSQGDRVRIEGALVRVLDSSGQVLSSSSTIREDTGDGACEVIWVDSLQINGRLFR